MVAGKAKVKLTVLKNSNIDVIKAPIDRTPTLSLLQKRVTLREKRACETIKIKKAILDNGPNRSFSHHKSSYYSIQAKSLKDNVIFNCI